MTDPDLNQIAQTVLSDHYLDKLLNPLSNAVAENALGETELPPVLYVVEPNGEEGGKVTVGMVPVGQIAGHTWNERRHQVMFNLGRLLDMGGIKVLAAAFFSEAWMRAFTPEEVRTRGHREVRTYEDKTERLVMFAKTCDGRIRSRTWDIDRNQAAEITALHQREDAMQFISPLLDRFWEGYHANRD